MEFNEINLNNSSVIYDRKCVEECLNNNTTEFLDKLDELWEEIGIDTLYRKQRGDIVIEHVKNLYEEILAEAIDERNKLFATITSLLEELNDLEKDLNFKLSVDGLESLPYNQVEEKLNEKIKNYRNILMQKRSEIQELIEKERYLCQNLGRKPKLLPMSPLPSQETINEFIQYLQNMSQEHFSRQEEFIEIKVQIIEIMNELEIEPSLDFERKIVYDEDSTFIVTDENMTKLKNFYISLKYRKEKMENDVEELREKIFILWDRLEESADYRNNFIEKYSGITITTYKALKTELIRCENEIKENIKIFVCKMREEIKNWWEKCFYSEEDKQKFVYFKSDCYTEDLLQLHEIEIEKLRHLYEKNKNIYILIVKQAELWCKLLELERKAKEPNRYKNRGGQLLKEEKERNSIRKQLPKIEEELLTLVQNFETEHGYPLKVKGQLVSEIINQNYEELKENRLVKSSSKKQQWGSSKSSSKSPKSVLCASNTNTKLTHYATPKRKVATHLFASASAKKTKTVIKNIPKIKVNGSTIRRVSLERQKRIEDKIIMKRQKEISSDDKSSTSDYDVFQMDLRGKPTCRSTLFMEENKINEEMITKVRGTPQKLRKTPSSINLRTKSPLAAGRLTPARGKLPIIF